VAGPELDLLAADLEADTPLQDVEGLRLVRVRVGRSDSCAGPQDGLDEHVLAAGVARGLVEDQDLSRHRVLDRLSTADHLVVSLDARVVFNTRSLLSAARRRKAARASLDVGETAPDYDASVTTTTATATRTIACLWQDAVARQPDGVAYLVEEDGEWKPVTWAEAGRVVDELAHGLLALGVRKGDAFAILASTRIEWVLFDFALALVGGVTAPVYMNSSPRDIAHVLAHSESIGVLCEDEDQRQKVDDAAIEHVLTFADLDDLRARGREHAQLEPDAVQRAAGEIGEEDLYTYIYTSGTTGPPKGCMIRHRNYYAM